MAISSDLEHLLVRWLPRQRWMPALGSRVGAEPDVTPQSVVRIAEVSDEDAGTVQCLLVVLTVRGPLRHTRLCVPLTVRTAEDFSLRPHLVGTVDDLLLGKSYVYDGAADPVFVLALADAIADARSGSGEGFRSSLAGDELPFAGDELPAASSAQPVAGGGRPVAGDELSDSSAKAAPGAPGAADESSPAGQRTRDGYGAALLQRAREHRFRRTEGLGSESRVEIDGPDGTYALTILREIGPANPPAVRYPLALTAVESSTVHPVIGWSQTTWYDDADLTTIDAPFALLAHALPGSRRAWRSAAEKVLVVDSGSVGSFNRQASVLGSVVGTLHEDLASEFGRVRSEGDPTLRLIRKWRERVEWALHRAPGALSDLADRLREHADGLDELESIGDLQRIHGELTLDHITVGTAEGPRVIGFGVVRDEPRPAEIDLVALVRSIDYAAGYAWLQRSEALADEEPVFRTLATHGLDDALREDYLGAPEHLWYRQTANSLLSGYSHARGATTALVDPVLRAALIDRLLVEVVSELRNRPAWLIVPLAALVETLGVDATTGGRADGRADDRADGSTDDRDAGAADDRTDERTADRTAADRTGGRVAGRAEELPHDDESLRVDAADAASDDSTIAAGADVLPDRAGIDDDRARHSSLVDADAEIAGEGEAAVDAEAPDEVVLTEDPDAPEESFPAEDSEESVPTEDWDGPVPTEDSEETVPTEDWDGPVPTEDSEESVPTEDPEGPLPTEDPDAAALTEDPDESATEAVPEAAEQSEDGVLEEAPMIPAKPTWSPSAMHASGADSEHDPALDVTGDGPDDESLDEDGAGDEEPDVGPPPRSARQPRI